VSGTLLFGLASVMLSLAIIPVSLTVALAPTTMEPVRLNFPRVWHISHAALLGAGISGLVTGAFWSLGPVFARGVGMDTTAVTLFMSAVVLGGAIFQLPIGKLSDHFERRLVLLGTAIVGVVISLLIPLLSASTNGLLILAPFWGGAIMTLYAISLAHAADGADAEEFVMVGSCLLITFGLSSACGAPLAGLFMELMGANGIFIYTALCLGCLAVAIAIRRRQRIVPDMPEEAEPFRAVADSSPAMFALDPRTGLELETESDGDAPFNTATSDHRF
jgi:predicted MFS family arabinose efflux permease